MSKGTRVSRFKENCFWSADALAKIVETSAMDVW